MMETMILHRALARRTKELTAWQTGAIGLLILAALHNAACTAALMEARSRLEEQTAQLEQAEWTRDFALEKLGNLALQAERDEQARVEQAAAYEAAGVYTYVGECIVTAYCPCLECCGQWADGLTATGLPAVPGIVAVDPEVIPLGSTVIINGQRYLAADTGVTGNHVDLCVLDHQQAEAFGVQMADVWVVAEGDKHG